MKTTLTRTISLETALEIAQGLIENAAGLARLGQQARRDCLCDGPCTCPSRWDESRIEGERIVISPDYHAGENVVSWPAQDTVHLSCQTCGGHRHTLEINVATGQMVVTHSGARRSFPGWGLDLLPQEWGSVNNIQDWTCTTVHTSRPDWAIVAGFLSGRLGDGPANQEEADNLLLQEAEAKLRSQAAAVGRKLPEVWALRLDAGTRVGFWESGPDGGREYRPRWTGQEYRRAAAQGVRL